VSRSNPVPAPSEEEPERATEPTSASALDGVADAQPALTRAQRIGERAASVGFDWPRIEPVVEKIEEELDELRADLHTPHRASEELGDVLFAVTNLARHLGIDAEAALHAASDRFALRFRRLERDVDETGKRVDALTLDELERFWQRAKDSVARSVPPSNDTPND